MSMQIVTLILQTRINTYIDRYVSNSDTVGMNVLTHIHIFDTPLNSF